MKKEEIDRKILEEEELQETSQEEMDETPEDVPEEETSFGDEKPRRIKRDRPTRAKDDEAEDEPKDKEKPYPYPVAIGGFVALIFVMLVFAVFALDVPLSMLGHKVQADNAYESGNYLTASFGYMDLIDNYTEDNEMAVRLVVSLCKASEFQQANSYYRSLELESRELTADQQALLDEWAPVAQDYVNMQYNVQMANQSLYEQIGALYDSEMITLEDAYSMLDMYFKLTLEDMIGGSEQNALYIFYRGMMEYDPELALPYLLDALEAEPKYTFIYAQIGRIYQSQEDYAKAREYYDLALSLFAEDPSALTGITMLDILEEDFPSALEHIQKLYNVYPTFSDVRELSLVAYMVNGRTDEAQAMLLEVAASVEAGTTTEAVYVELSELVEGTRTWQELYYFREPDSIETSVPPEGEETEVDATPTDAPPAGETPAEQSIADEPSSDATISEEGQ